MDRNSSTIHIYFFLSFEDGIREQFECRQQYWGIQLLLGVDMLAGLPLAG